MSNASKVLSVTEKSTKALISATTGLGKILADLEVNVQLNEEVIESVYIQQAKLDSLGDQTLLEARKQTVELDLLVKENESDVLQCLLNKLDLAQITNTKLDELYVSLKVLQNGNTAELDKAVSQAVNADKARSSAVLANTVSEHKVTTATLIADAKALSNEIVFLKRSIDTLEVNAEEERKARIAIAESDAKKAGITFNNGK